MGRGEESSDDGEGRLCWEMGFDPSQPDETPRKLLAVSRLNGLGWRARVPLNQRIAQTYAWFLGNERGWRG